MRRGCFSIFGFLAALAIIIGALFVLGRDYIEEKIVSPDPVTVAAASLQGMREQARLSTFAARYVAVVTSTQRRMGLSARKTLIMPGDVRYEVDLAKLQDKDLRWDANSNTLSVVLPPIEVVGPEVDMTRIREYSEGGILMSLTDAESALDTANREAGQKELLRQARGDTPMRLARESTRRAIERSFLMPLRAAGVEAKVQVFFPDEVGSGKNEIWDISPSIQDVLSNRN
ncbi:DUF4230 domain-containing protein [Stakelama tenebrarum]|uniref:DUF4230 domain-containing protein n=1 Tax=Stakelama tenebrarum TaxID=2711215 RepID=A0A6G6Y8L6_9SPHN|nr:DUF4230 domain-containing protein [Sphingosinithalassobacter tenebrarum]QIG81191.1 DUF4230 domain-containing protein [Sphingosinithalassobacter tenebrarum]